MKPVKLRMFFEEYSVQLLIDNSLFVRDLTDESVTIHIPAQVVNTLVDEITGATEEEVMELRDKITTLEDRLEEEQDERRWAESDADDLRRELESTQENLADAETERDRLADQVRELEAQAGLWNGELPY